MLLTPQDRYTGCLLGLAAGDALGAPVEFQPPGSFAPITDLLSGGAFNLQPGQYTDDTTMALCLAESILEKGAFDPVDQLERYVRWYRQGYLSSTGVCFDIGNTTRASLEDFERNRQPYRAEGGTTASNGAIMRLAPAALAFANRPAEAVRLCGDSARTTHNFVEAVDTCRLLGALIVGALAGEPKTHLLAPGYAPAPGLWESEPFSTRVQAISQGAYQHKQPPEIRGGGQAVECLEAALWAFYHSQGFADGLLLAVNLGDDADTTGAVYGQLAGAYYGLPAIPARWLESLWEREMIEDTALKLCAFAGNS